MVYWDRYSCRGISPEILSSFESQMFKAGSVDAFYCVLIYRPPGPASVFLTDFTDFLSSIIKLESVLLLGDINLHIDDASCKAAELLTITDAFNFKQHVSGPTHLDLRCWHCMCRGCTHE